MSWLYLALIAIAFSYCSCEPAWFSYNNRNRDVTNERMSLNQIMDECLVDIQKAVKKFGFDPMRIPPVHHNTSVTIGFISHDLKLNLTNGVIAGASTFKRKGNSYAKFLPHTIRVLANVQVDKLFGKFNFSYATWIYSDKGVLNTTIENATAVLQVDYELLNTRLANPKLKIINIGKVHIDMSSDATFSWLTNTIANVAIPYFKTEIIKTAEKTSLKIANMSVRRLNKNIDDIIAESIAQVLLALTTGTTSRRPTSRG